MSYEMTPEILAYLEWELRPRSMVCHWCGYAEIESQKTLEANGWLLSKLELCPQCNESKCLAQSEAEVENAIQRNGDRAVRTVRDWKLPLVRSQVEKALHND